MTALLCFEPWNEMHPAGSRPVQSADHSISCHVQLPVLRSACSGVREGLRLRHLWLALMRDPANERADLRGPRPSMRRLGSASGCAEKAGIVVLASHKHDLLRSFCNKVMELEHGRIKSFQQLK